MQNFIIAKATHPGQVRQVNEDSMTVFDSVNGHVMVVCDGMGGQAAGDQASQLAVSIIENILTDNQFNTPEEAISSSVVAANQGILNRQAQNPELDGMGSTCVMLIIKEGKVHCGWVGDSRIYYISNHTIRQISKDQSYVQQLVDAGQLTPEEAEHHPQKNEITNCLGIQGMTPPEVLQFPITPEPGSVFLLCSDGLSGMVDNARIERLVSSQELNLHQKANQLVQMANEAGGLDNITVELVQFGNNSGGATSGTLFETPEGMEKAETKKKGGKSKLMMLLAGLIVLVGLGTGAYYSFAGGDDDKKEVTNTEQKGGTQGPRNTPKPDEASKSSSPQTNVTTVTVKKESKNGGKSNIDVIKGSKKKVDNGTNGEEVTKKKKEDDLEEITKDKIEGRD